MEVVILCGGLGTRLRSAVGETPKCLAPVGGRPFLLYLLRWLGSYHVDHVVFAVGYLKEQIMDFMASREWPFRYSFAVEETPLGTGGGIRNALAHCEEEKVFVVNGDSFFPVALDRVRGTEPVTVLLKPMRDFARYGAVDFDGRRITAFREKAPCAEGLINGGLYLVDRSRLDLHALPEKFSFETDVLAPMAAAGSLGGAVSGAYFIDIGIPEDYAVAQWSIPAWFAVKAASEAVLKCPAQTLFLDRDGVLNRLLEGDYVKSWEAFEWMPGILEEMARWHAHFRRIILVTNQRGVGKGLMTDADLARIHSKMMAGILEAGGRIDLILTCTAVSDDDPRRKPHPGMFEEACALFPDIRPEDSVMLGDSASDAAFAAAAGMDFILLSPEAVSWDSWERPA